MRRNKSTVAWAAGILIAILAACITTNSASAGDTALVRSVYETPIPQDPMVLWDRVADLRSLKREADAKTLEEYLERTAIAQILGEPTWSAPTLEQLLRAERAAPVMAPEQIGRVLAMVDAAPGEAAYDDNVPKDYRGAVQYRYEGHSVWSQLRNAKEAFLGVQLTNHTGHNVDSLSALIHIVRGSESIRVTCYVPIYTSVLHAGASAVAMCPTVQVESTARPGFYTVIDTPTLIELMQSVEQGDATLSIQLSSVHFPEYTLFVSQSGAEPFNAHFRARTLPTLNVTCEDRGTCGVERAAERTAGRDRVLFSPQLWLIGTVLVAAGIGYVLLSGVVRLGGGSRALPRARLVGAFGVLVCFGIASWSWHALEAHTGGGAYGGLGYFVFLVIAAAVGIGLLIATLLVRSPDDDTHS